MKNTSKKSILLLILFVFNAIAAPVLAQVTEADKAQIEQKQKELQNIEGQIGEKKQQMDSKRKKARSAYEQLSEVTSALDLAQAELSEIVSSLEKVQDQMSKNEEVLRNVEKNLVHRNDAYKKRIRNIYMHGQMNYLDVLLGSKNFTDFTTRFELLLRIIKNDVNLIDEIKNDQVVLKSQQEKLKNNKEEIEKLYDQANAKKQVVYQKREEKRVIFEQAEAERQQAESEYNDLMETSKSIANMIRRIESGGKLIGQGTGSMIWPIRGEITSPFGWRTHPIFGTQKYHSGLDIAADYNDPILAADEGVVISAGWIGGYGNAVILDHGSGITTLYAHNNSLAVSNGEKVYKGQTIAYAGSTGYSTGPHCHFEVRKHGETVSPLDYLP